MICLDTNAIIAAINRRTPHVRERLERVLVNGVAVGIPVIALYEIGQTDVAQAPYRIRDLLLPRLVPSRGWLELKVA
jgi:predicted nucleic acid-binding protein